MSGQRIDVWLHRARFCKTRSGAARLIADGGVRLVREGQVRRLEKGSSEVAVNDMLVFALAGKMRSVRVAALPARRGPPAEAQALYVELDAEQLA